jgi:N-acetylneuraminic acid mutarotase
MFSPKKAASTIFLMLFLSFPVTSFLICPAKAAEDSWTTLESMSTARHWLGVAVVDGKIYAMGGYVNGRFSNLNEMYDPKTNTWVTKTPLPKPRSGFGIAVYQNKIFIFGGSGYIYGSVPGFIETTDVYDLETDTWTNGATMLTSRYSLGVAVVNDELYTIGGYNGDTDLAVNEKYTPQGYIPEFPSWIILPLLLTATLVAIFFKKMLATTVSNS